MSSPWHPTDASVAAAVGKYTSGHSKTYMLLLDPNWKAPTGDTYQLVTLTSPDEMTCLTCGETFAAGRYCDRCGLSEDGSTRFPTAGTAAVRTLDYLQEGGVQTMTTDDLLAAIQNAKRRADVVPAYTQALWDHGNTDWSCANTAITLKWSKAGLIWIKQQSWKSYEKREAI